MKSNSQRLLAKALMFALLVFMALPTVALAQRRDRDRDGVPDRIERRRERRDDRRDDRRDRRQDRRNDGYYGNNGGYNNDNYGNLGGSNQLRQTALNAGYNNGMEEGRKDRDRNERFNYADESDYRNANKDYSSRLGDRGAYQRYFREAFARGYRDGFNGGAYNNGYRY
jgi:hypothetical protein